MNQNYINSLKLDTLQKKKRVQIKINKRQQQQIQQSLNKSIKYGPITLDINVVYEGKWLDEMKDGFESITWFDDLKYIGQWKLDKMSGKGRIIHTNGNYYEGE
ncbi:hypothetical protein IMG5_024470 [Ichthyophthirius multifiliis]|uniref:MORN repeat protein n=1 Tax=Ichthyophthirius multifiliis TaxID=5932 RepID=G0QL20_ICHMU|nr:hypothetical protein IMG5_024470 [Ichthyophthirius multifiliis]EGR34076.1 hypothetical protein IMG5_024470 [Ichthyophthirius multifiliis]|eukprot:XP_004039380.1 hypothetical protein IMG5_024470 [Ichthyophthirius multifiliis]